MTPSETDALLQARLCLEEPSLSPAEFEAVAEHVRCAPFVSRIRGTRHMERGWWFGEWVAERCPDLLLHAIRRHLETEGLWAGRMVPPERYLLDLRRALPHPQLALARSFRLDKQAQLLAYAPPQETEDWHLLVVYDPYLGAIRTGYSNSNKARLLAGTGEGFRWLGFRHLRF